ncbi:DNA alkylation repair protein [Ammoniphilus sp. CFH 90114]|uniref:DNA alkylation repair protein n=1 Tax=Ammoniphilus sp. CFH 90114 TaxID=2493665 RepID=UPI00100FB006|nr:DNA alkylation repair protein [Ammoniphilus sp. CFH 90114]RXT13623.1 DNA alkylation repair protein [Ammoniphilus sp. CFH 90114]
MSHPYLCPNCKTNRSRFNIIQQVSKSIKMDAQTGNVMEVYQEDIPPFHLPYGGPAYRVQCAACSIIEDEEQFIKAAKNYTTMR